MTRVDFYLLPETAGNDTVEKDRDRLIKTVCQLIDKATRQKKSVFVNAASPELADKLDTALWGFRADSFIPHRILAHTSSSGTELPQAASSPNDSSRRPNQGSRISKCEQTSPSQNTEAEPPAHHEDLVEIGCGMTPLPRIDSCHHVLINLADEVPFFFSRYERTLEVVGCEEAQRASSRKRYTFYKERGYPLNHHKLA